MARYIRKSYWLLIFTAFVYTGGGEVWAQSADPQDVEASSENADAHEQSSAGLPQLDPKWYPSQLFWLFLTYGVLYFAFSRNVLPGLSGIIENRRDHIKNDLDQAEKLRAPAEKVQCPASRSRIFGSSRT